MIKSLLSHRKLAIAQYTSCSTIIKGEHENEEYT